MNPDTSTDLNPYKPTRGGERPRAANGTRYLWMVLCAGGFASLSIGVGILIAKEAFSISQNQGYGVEISKGYFVASGFVGLGVLWAGSSALFWLRRNGIASKLCVVTFAGAGLYIVLLMLGLVP